MRGALPVPASDEVKAPDERIANIVALATLPGIWSGAAPLRIAESLAAALFTAIEPAFVYVALNTGPNRPPARVAQIGRDVADPGLADQIHAPIVEWTRTRNPDELLALAGPGRGGALKILARSIGSDAEFGVVAAGYDGRRPETDDYLLLAVAANQASTAIQNAYLVQSLRESEERFTKIVDEAPIGVYLLDSRLRIRGVNPVALPIFRNVPRLLGRDFGEVINAIWPEQYAGEIVRLTRRTLATGEPYVTPERIEDRCTHRLPEQFEWRIIRILLPQGEYGILSYFRDVAAHVSARKRLRLLLDELNHRVKNTVATVQSIVAQTLRNAGSTEQARDVVDDRLLALSKAHDILTLEHWEGGDLHNVVAGALAAYKGSHEQRFRIEGPACRLRPRAVLALSLALHELATNSVKYGALANGTGVVTIRWHIASAPLHRLELVWTETGGPPVLPPRSRGFGARLIQRGLVHDLCADVRLEFDPAGVVCSIVAPLSEIRPVPILSTNPVGADN